MKLLRITLFQNSMRLAAQRTSILSFVISWSLRTTTIHAFRYLLDYRGFVPLMQRCINLVKTFSSQHYSRYLCWIINDQQQYNQNFFRPPIFLRKNQCLSLGFKIKSCLSAFLREFFLSAAATIRFQLKYRQT